MDSIPHHPNADAERFRSLHGAASDLLADLEGHYELSSSSAAKSSPWIASFWPDAAVTTLVPVGAGASVTVALTAYPGVMITFGHNGRAAFPQCGCTSCEEDPAEEADRLVDTISDVVAGGLTETRRRRMLRSDLYERRLVHRGGSGESASSEAIGPDHAPMPRGTTAWPPWRSAP